MKPLRRIEDDDDDIPLHKRMNADTYHKLNHFFVPFIDTLSLISGINLTFWYKRDWPSPSLILTSQDNSIENISTTMKPTEWYELEDSKEDLILKKSWRAQLMAALLPKKTAQDSGYNTTVGMLTMF